MARELHEHTIEGRVDECARIEALLEALGTGTGGGLQLVGEPGTGKTTLLAWARMRAGAATVLETVGAEGEARSRTARSPTSCAAFQISPLLVWTDDVATARRLVQRELELWRDVVSLSLGFAELAAIELASDRPVEALDAATRAAQLTEEHDDRAGLARALALVATAAAVLGRAADCREAAATARALAQEFGWRRYAVEADAAEGALARVRRWSASTARRAAVAAPPPARPWRGCAACWTTVATPTWSPPATWRSPRDRCWQRARSSRAASGSCAAAAPPTRSRTSTPRCSASRPPGAHPTPVGPAAPCSRPEPWTPRRAR